MDFIYALRRIRSTPTYSIVAILLIGLGIGTNLAVFSLVNALFLASLPLPEPEALAALQNINQQGHSRAFSYPMYQRFSNSQEVFSELAAWSAPLLSLEKVDGAASPANSLLVSGEFFKAMGIEPLQGRPIGEQDVVQQAAVALVSHGLWQREFGSDPDIVGKQLRVQQTPVEVIGVVGPQFTGLDVGLPIDLVLPLSFFQPGGMSFQAPEILWLNLWGHLNRGVSMAQAEAGLQALWPQILEESVPPAFEGQRREAFLTQQLKIAAAGKGFSPLRGLYREPLTFLTGLTGLMLLITCLNVAMLLLIRAAGMASGWAVRLSVGASRWQIVAQELRETLVLCALGGMVGFLLYYWIRQSLPAFLTLRGINPQLDLGVDQRMALFWAAIVLATALLAGLFPSLRLFRLDLGRLLRDNPSGGGKWSQRSKAGNFLTIVQIALSLLLAIAAGALIQSLQLLKLQDLGFGHQKLLIVRLQSQGNNAQNVDFSSYYQQLLEKVQSLHGVYSASLIHPPPLMPIRMDSRISRQEYTPAPGEDMSADRSYVAPGFLEAAGIALLRGRGFNSGDDENNAKAALINQAMAERFFPEGEAVGRHFRLRSNPDEEIRVVGVVQDAKLRDIRQEVRPAFYLACFQYPYLRELTLLVRAKGRPGDLGKPVAQAIAALGVERPFSVSTASGQMDTLLSQDRSLATLSSLFGVLTLALACIGVYGTVTYRTTLRTREFGIRVALGARQRHLGWLVLRSSLFLVAAGLALGAALGTAASNWLAGFVFGLTVPDPILFALCAALVSAACAAAACLPAYRASRSDPALALRRD